MSEDTKYKLDDLIELMARLRDPLDGCPWDLQQNYQSIVPSTIEEAYEVADAIERGNYADLRDELGDLMFQTVFYSQLASEEGLFDLEEVISTLVTKLVRRHPHVFPDGTLASRKSDSVPSLTSSKSFEEQRIKDNWEQIKRKERLNKGQLSVLDDIPLNLPALSRAQKTQKRAASLGFDWQNAEQVLPKIDEELVELREAMEQQDKEAIEEELGDLFFSCVNLSRKLKLDSEQVLRKAEKKFGNRFRKVEQAVESEGFCISDLSIEQLEAFWQKAKNKESV